MAALLTATAYAKRIGKSQSYVSRLVRAGKITLTRGKIDPKKADRELALNRHGRQTKPSSRKPTAKKAPQKKAAKKAPAKRGPGRPVKGPERGAGGDTMFAAQLRRERAKAEREELLLRREKGELVDKAEVRSTVFTLARATRDAMLRIPARIRSQLAAEGDELKVGALLEAEIRKALDQIAEAPLERLLA